MKRFDLIIENISADYAAMIKRTEKFITCYCNHDKCENGRCRDESCLVGIDRSGKKNIEF
ncbi:hypothetical protein T11_8610 [Trichinella zimbabwensis]|uniref:Uncharacterized protein n=1 Tax=Trichinella zimbabwensis TaxID=268475 RepID=A0A0V1GVV0_9BILA|nr:hypothetical protein T11_8610 [Trichinella zimbabwensis]